MLAFAERITDEAKLDRVLPYVVALLNDRADIVKAAALRTLTQLVSSSICQTKASLTFNSSL